MRNFQGRHMPQSDRAGFIKHFLYVFGAQIFVLMSGLFKALLVPIVLGVEDFGYWQIYVFYTVYIGFFTLGYNDGIYLRYGGKTWAGLPIQRLRTTNAIYLFLMALFTGALLGIAFTIAEGDRKFIFVGVALNIFILGFISNVSLTLQAVNRLKVYAALTSADKAFFTIALLALFNESLRSFQYLVIVDVVSKLVVLIFLGYAYRPLFLGKMARLKEGLQELSESVQAGIQLMLANISGMLVLGVGRLIIEYFGGLANYSHYAFSISLSNIVLISISAISIVLYPALKQQPTDQYTRYFNSINNAYLGFSILMLTTYFLAVVFVKTIAINYSPVLEFLNVIFAITVLQGKMQLVNNTYYKALRLERQMLVANFSSLLIVVVVSVLGYYMSHSILVIAYSAFATMVFRVYSSEIFLRRKLTGTHTLRPLWEILILLGYLVITTFAQNTVGAIIWLNLIFIAAWFYRRVLIAYVLEIKVKFT